MPFIPHTEKDVKQMLEAIGADSINELFDEIPENLQVQDLAHVPEGVGEMVLARSMRKLALKDIGADCYIGAGAYDHHIPAAVWEVAGRGEFMTAYTPYQAEASQGGLQLLYEYQTMMASLMGMEVSNASLYDGASGLAEAILMAVRAHRKSKSRKVLMPATVNPVYRNVAETLVHNQHIEIVEIPYDAQKGIADLTALSAFEGEDITAVVIPQPNFFGNLEQADQLTDWAHKQGALAIAVVNPLAMALIKEPGSWGEKGVDIACGDGQPFGLPMASGGPYFGFLCCNQNIVRQMPGRIIGRTVDQDGKVGYTLTLQAREQHIRRSKATSNICTNQGLAVTAATIHMSIMGAEGLRKVALASHDNTNQLIEKLTSIAGVETVFNSPRFHEAVLRLPRKASEVLKQLIDKDIIGGYDLSADYPELENCILVCATETKLPEHLELYYQALKDVLA